jgi:hypothetical protein
VVISFYAALGCTVSGQPAPRDSCSTPSTGCASAADEQAAEPGNCRSLGLGDPFAAVDAMALSAGPRKAGNSNCVAPKTVSLVLALEEQSREVGSMD